jgi:hypothetical protein
MSTLRENYKYVISLLRRLKKANRKAEWQEGETLNEVFDDVNDFLDELSCNNAVRKLRAQENKQCPTSKNS